VSNDRSLFAQMDPRASLIDSKIVDMCGGT
jgi:hypothetical protein